MQNWGLLKCKQAAGCVLLLFISFLLPPFYVYLGYSVLLLRLLKVVMVQTQSLRSYMIIVFGVVAFGR